MGKLSHVRTTRKRYLPLDQLSNDGILLPFIRTRRAPEKFALPAALCRGPPRCKVWDREWRAVARIEATTLDLNIRFVVSPASMSARPSLRQPVLRERPS